MQLKAFISMPKNENQRAEIQKKSIPAWVRLRLCRLQFYCCSGTWEKAAAFSNTDLSTFTSLHFYDASFVWHLGGTAWVSPSERKCPRKTLPHLMRCCPQLTNHCSWEGFVMSVQRPLNSIWQTPVIIRTRGASCMWPLRPWMWGISASKAHVGLHLYSWRTITEFKVIESCLLKPLERETERGIIADS